MTRVTFLKTLFLISLFLMILGPTLKITYTGGPLGSYLLITGSIIRVVYSIFSIIEVLRFPQLKPAEKVMWTTGFVFFSELTGFLYYFSARSRIIRSDKLRPRLGT